MNLCIRKIRWVGCGHARLNLLVVAVLSWLLAMSNFVTAAVIQPDVPTTQTDTPDAQKTDSQNETAGTPKWFLAEAEYDAKTQMAYIKSAEPQLTREEARENLGKEALRLANEVAMTRLDGTDSEILRFDGDSILAEFCFEDRIAFPATEQSGTAGGSDAAAEGKDFKYFTGFAQLHFDSKFDELIQQTITDNHTLQRLQWIGVIGGSVLSILFICFGYFKMEIATRGFYSRRLQTISLILSVGVMVAAYFLSLIHI